VNILNASQALLLIVVSNSVPWAAGQLLGRRWAAPLDLGAVLWDGKRLFGSHKTWRGLVAGTLASGLVGAFTGLSFVLGAGVGAVSLVADALSSAVKRRLRLAPGTEVLGLDQLPEALLPLLIFAPALSIGALEIVAATAAFLILDVLVTRLRHRQPAVAGRRTPPQE